MSERHSRSHYSFVPGYYRSLHRCSSADDPRLRHRSSRRHLRTDDVFRVSRAVVRRTTKEQVLLPPPCIFPSHFWSANLLSFAFVDVVLGPLGGLSLFRSFVGVGLRCFWGRCSARTKTSHVPSLRFLVYVAFCCVGVLFSDISTNCPPLEKQEFAQIARGLLWQSRSRFDVHSGQLSVLTSVLTYLSSCLGKRKSLTCRTKVTSSWRKRISWK